jgi:hypothetical protein
MEGRSVKETRRVALSRHNAPAWLALDGLEVVALRKLPAWMRWLYMELRALSDFKTGHVSTSWAQLVALMDCDAGERGGQSPHTPGMQQLRRAVDQLEGIGLLRRDGRTNERARGLFLFILPIKSLGAPAAKRDRSCDRPPTGRKASKHAGFEASALPVATGVATGDSVPLHHSPKAPKAPDLSTAPAPPETVHPIDVAAARAKLREAADAMRAKNNNAPRREGKNAALGAEDGDASATLRP